MRSGSLCALLWRLLLWCNQRQIVLRARHIPGHLNVIADKLSRHKQVIQTEWTLLQGVFDLLCQRWHKPEVNLFATRFNHKLPMFVSPVPDRLAWKVEPGHVCLSSGGNSRTGGHQAVGPRMLLTPSDCTRMAQHALVLGPSQNVSSDSPCSSHCGKFTDSTVQSVPTQRSPQPKSACLAPRVAAIQQAGFSDKVATRIEAPQRRSTRAVYESKWTVFVRWCEENKVDFRSPSIKQIADFLLYLFQEKCLQPSTIDGYRTAIADELGNKPDQHEQG